MEQCPTDCSCWTETNRTLLKTKLEKITRGHPMVIQCMHHATRMLKSQQSCQLFAVNYKRHISLHFIGHFPGEPGLARVYWSKGWWRWWWQLDYWSCKSCKAPAKSPPSANQHPVFYRPDALPVAQPTVSKHRREKYHIPWTCLPQAHLWVFQLCLWPLIAPGYHRGGLPCLSSNLHTPTTRVIIHFKMYYNVKKNFTAIIKVQS